MSTGPMFSSQVYKGVLDNSIEQQKLGQKTVTDSGTTDSNR